MPQHTHRRKCCAHRAQLLSHLYPNPCIRVPCIRLAGHATSRGGGCMTQEPSGSTNTTQQNCHRALPTLSPVRLAASSNHGAHNMSHQRWSACMHQTTGKLWNADGVSCMHMQSQQLTKQCNTHAHLVACQSSTQAACTAEERCRINHSPHMQQPWLCKSLANASTRATVLAAPWGKLPVVLGVQGVLVCAHASH